MGWWLLLAVLMAPRLSLRTGAFVGAFLPDGTPLPIQSPVNGRWVSAEQVQREMRFRCWQPPLTTLQMAELARGLEADFAVDVLAAPVRERRRWYAFLLVRVVSAPLKATVHLAQARIGIRSPDEVPHVVAQVAPSLLANLPSQIAPAIVQLREGAKRLHLQATTENWRKGTQLLFYREAGKEVTVLGKGRIVSITRLADGNRWLIEADLTTLGASVRPGDKAVTVFALPSPFAALE